MENFILLEEDNTALDICKAETLEDAKDIFALRGWIADNVISQKDLIENTIKSLDTWASKKNVSSAASCRWKNERFL